MADTVRMPDGSVISSDEFRQRVSSGQIAGGPNGSAENSAINTGQYSDPYASANPATPASSGSGGGSNSGGSPLGNAANTAFGGISGNSSPAPTSSSIPANARQEDVYALRSNDDPTSWAKRVGAQGTADYGPKALNPYLDQNPLANSPFTQFYQNRYGTSAPTNNLVADEIAGTSPTASVMQGQAQQNAQGQNLGPTNTGDARSNLQGVLNLVNQQAQGGGTNNTSQRLFAGDLINDPQLATQIVTSQMQGSTGGWGMNYLANQASNLANHYYNDPANQGPQSPNGSFLQQLMKQMGMA